ncbi:MAG: glycosyl hydrolase family 28 protein [Clostridia bacterium]|nr:glycosyl hydrolase family 28 protein [Clostridia bacterium]
MNLFKFRSIKKKVSVLILIFSFMLFVVSQYLPFDIVKTNVFASSALIAHWPLDSISSNSTPDTSNNGSAANGTVSGTASIVNDPDRGSVLKLSGNGYINCGNPSKISGTGSFSLSVWVRKALFNKDNEAIFTKGNDWGLQRSSASNFVEFYAGGLSNKVSNSNYQWDVGVSDGAWHNIVGVYNGSEMRIYIDGRLSSVSVTGTRTTSSNNIFIGANSAYTGRNYTGLIDDVRIYSQALTLDEIAAIYRGEDPDKASQPTPFAGENVAWPSSSNITLSWTAGLGASAHRIYVGTDKDLVRSAGTSSEEYKGEQTGSSYTMPVSKDATYWWRVDEIRSGVVVKGNVWGFNVINSSQNNLVQVAALPTGLTASSKYSMQVNGTAVPVFKYETERAYGWGASEVTRRAGIARFSFAGRATIQINCTQNIPKFWRLSPENYQVPVAVNGNTMTFSITRPGVFVLHYGGKFGINCGEGLVEKLIIIADPLESNKPPSSGAGVINLVARGIDNTGSSFVTAQIQQAINDANAAGGGTVYVPSGTYNINDHIYMKSNVRLHLEQGAMIRATTTRIDGGVGMIDFTNVNNASLTGRGILFANGSHFRKDSYDAPDYNNAPIILIESSTNINVRDVMALDPGNMNCFIAHSQSVNITGVKFISDADYANTDGIDPNDGCSDINIDDLFIQNTDDCFAPGYQESMENITISNAVLWNTHNGCMTKIGAQYAQFMRKIHYENITGIQSMVANHMFTHKYTANIYESYLKGINAENLELSAFRMETTYDGIDGGEPGPGQGRIYNIKFARWDLPGVGTSYFGDFSRSRITGSPPDQLGSHDVSDVVFNDLYLGGKRMTSLTDLTNMGFEINNYVSNISFPSTNIPLVSIKPNVLYGIEGTTNPSFTISRKGNLTNALTVYYRIEGSASNSTDYSNLNGSITIPANTSSITLPISLVNDGIAEGTESVCIVLQPQKLTMNYVVSPQYRAQVAIADPSSSPPTPTVYSFDDASGGAVNGVHSGIDFGTGLWEGGGNYYGLTKCGYFSSNVNSRSFTLPTGKVLKSIKISTGTANTNYTISDGVNTNKTGTLTQIGSPVTITTNWTNPGATITITFSSGWDNAIDDITYQ